MKLRVHENAPLADLVTLKTGGPATFLIEVYTVDDLKEAVAFAEQKQLPLFVIGGGSNLLVSDEGFKGVVVKISIKGRLYTHQSKGKDKLTVGAGETLDEIVSETVDRNLWGLENLSHIPGTVGATPVQNVGAYGVEVADVIESVEVFDINSKNIFTLKNSECLFSYRHSIFKEKNNLIILSVSFILSTIANPKINYADLKHLYNDEISLKNIRLKLIEIRSFKFPDWQTVGTAGSFFKNPIITHEAALALAQKYPDIPTYPVDNRSVKVALGYILDKVCGLKGFSIGKVKLYENQALVLVAENGATTNDIKSFVKKVMEEVFLKTNIKISQEVTEI